MSSAGYIVLVHCVTWLPGFLADMGQLSCLSTLKKNGFPVFMCVHYSFNCNQIQKAQSAVSKQIKIQGLGSGILKILLKYPNHFHVVPLKFNFITQNAMDFLNLKNMD